MYLRNIVFNIEEILRQATMKDPPGDISLSEIRKRVYSLISPEDKRKLVEGGSGQLVFDKKVSGNLSTLYRRAHYVTKPIKEKPIYRLNVDHPKVQKWIKEKWYEKGITIGGSRIV